MSGEEHACRGGAATWSLLKRDISYRKAAIRCARIGWQLLNCKQLPVGQLDLGAFLERALDGLDDGQGTVCVLRSRKGLRITRDRGNEGGELSSERCTVRVYTTGRLATAILCPTRRMDSLGSVTLICFASSGYSSARIRLHSATTISPPTPEATRPSTSRCRM